MTSDFGTVGIGQSSPATTFTVTNTGPSASDQVQVTLSGSADFHITANTCQTLAPAATCTIGVVLSPSTVGAKNASLGVAVTGSATTSMLAGNAVNANEGLTVSPSSFAFANAIVNATGVDVDTVTVTNVGGTTTGSLTVQAAGSDPTQFTKSADTCNGKTLAAGATCSLTIKFAPTTAGAKSASFAVIGTPGGTVTHAVSGTALTQAALAIAPTTQSFGSVVQGQTSSTVAINVANIGGSPTGALTTNVTGTNANSFAVVTSSCNTVLAASATCQVTLRYTPSLVGAESATLTVAGTPGGSVTSSLTGTGINAGQLSIDPTTFAFATTQVGATSNTSTFTLTNGGGVAAGPVVINLSGTDAGQFHVVGGSDNCSNATLQPAGKCTFGIAFSPSSVGTKSAVVVASANGTSITAALSGAGTPAPQLALTPASKDFGSNGVGTTSAAATFTLSNTGGAATTVPTIAISGTNADQFVQTNNCATAIAPAGSCTISVVFKPTATGLDAATLTATAATGGSASANLFGQGNNPAQISVLPSSLTFAATIGDQATQTFTIQNNGSTTTGPINVAITSTGVVQFSQTSNCTTLAFGATCTVTVVYAPTQNGSAAGTATVTATPGGSATVALAGTASPRLELVSIDGVAPTNPFDFGRVFLTVPKTSIFVLRNNTNATQSFAATFDMGTDAAFTLASGGASNCGSTIAAHASCAFGIRFLPTSVGVKTGGIAVTIGSGPTNAIDEKFTGTGVPAIAITPVTTANFGNVVVGTTSPALSFKLTNTSDQTLDAPTVTTLNAPFVAAQGTCTAGSTLAPGAFCTATVTFHPTTLGPETSSIVATATINGTGAPAGSSTLDVTGTGVNATDLRLEPAPTDFGTVFAGTTKDISIVVTNPAGSQTAGAMNWTLVGASEFTILNDGSAGDCVNHTTALTNGTSCNIRVRFSPVTFDDSGTRALSGTLTVVANPGAAGTGISTAISGVSRSTLSIAPTTWDFGVVQPGDSAAKTFTVHNDSSATVALAGPALGGTTVGLSITGSTCTGNLPANGDCTVEVTFAPTGVGTADNATLTVASTNAFGRAVAVITASSPDVLYDQFDNATGTGYVSMISTFGSDYDGVGADDFIVPAGGWTLTGIDVGFYDGSPAALGWTVKVYANTSELPGAVITTQSGITAFTYGVDDPAHSNQEVKITLAPIALTPGHYWISVQAEGQNFEYWSTRTVGSNDNAAALYGPAYGQCATFAYRSDCAGGDPDNMFRLHGHLGAGPVHVPTVTKHVPAPTRHVAPPIGRPSARAPR